MPVSSVVLRSRAVKLLGNLGKAAQPAAPALVQTYEYDPDPGVRGLAVICLKTVDPIGTNTFAVMREAATNSDLMIRDASAYRGKPEDYVYMIKF